MRFDWYEGAILDDPVVVLDQLRKLGHSLKPCDGLARMKSFRQGFQVIHNDLGTVATVVMGGNDRKDDRPYLYAWASSENTDNYVALVRDRWPEDHLVSRADPAEDFIEEGITKRMLPVMKRVAKKHKLKFARRMDMLDKTAGITQYMGSDSSDYKVRGYEKGYEQIGKIDVFLAKNGVKADRENLMITNTLTGEMIRPQDWFRLELQMRPRQEDAKRLLATLTPEQAWGCTTWTRDLALEAMALDLERIVMRTRKHTTTDESLGWMCRFYSGAIEKTVAEKGELEAMRYIRSIIRRQNEG
jgi:hypothetical protein